MKRIRIYIYAVILILYFIYRIKFFIKYFSSCIVIRISDVTYEQIHRYNMWLHYFPQEFKFYFLSMRVTNISYISNSKIEQIVVSYNDILYSFPNIMKLNGNCSTFKSFNLISWISHSESIILFYKKIKMKYKYIWIIEQDVGYTGNLYRFIKLYDNNNNDLITFNVGKKNNKWVWFYCATDKYIRRRMLFFNDSYGYANREYVQRWSDVYISKISSDLFSHYHSQSESSSIEAVFYHNLTYEEIPKKYIGSPLCAGKSITQNKWKSILSNKSKSNKFFHPLKF